MLELVEVDRGVGTWRHGTWWSLTWSCPSLPLVMSLLITKLVGLWGGESWLEQAQWEGLGSVMALGFQAVWPWKSH
jgi:hypothetical protein